MAEAALDYAENMAVLDAEGRPQRMDHKSAHQFFLACQVTLIGCLECILIGCVVQGMDAHQFFLACRGYGEEGERGGGGRG
jgi:hypothetical protein